MAEHVVLRKISQIGDQTKGSPLTGSKAKPSGTDTDAHTCDATLTEPELYKSHTSFTGADALLALQDYASQIAVLFTLQILEIPDQTLLCSNKTVAWSHQIRERYTTLA